MATTLEALEQRLAALEQEVQSLRDLIGGRPDETPAERGARMVRVAKASQPAISAGMAKAFKEMGITGEPIGHEKLQEMMLAGGINPEDNACSREIIAMRDE
jgi:hypothetical protein